MARRCIEMGQEVMKMETDGFSCASALLPEHLRAAAEALPAEKRLHAEELRLRRGRTPTVLSGGREWELCAERVDERTLLAVLERASDASLHAVEEELRRGFLTARGGVRVGVCGAVSLQNGGVGAMREVSSLAVRIPRAVRGAAAEVLPKLGCGGVLLLSPPGGGKTTMLRELIRCLSDGGERVGVADERGELAAMWNGEPQFDLGRSTDVLSGAPKAEAAMMLLRGMNCQAIAMDEISLASDAAAVEQLTGCGVRVLATVHAVSADELTRRSAMRELLALGAFDRAVTIRAEGGVRHYRVDRL